MLKSEFERFRIVQDRVFCSDFDRVVKQVEREGTARKKKQE